MWAPCGTLRLGVSVPQQTLPAPPHPQLVPSPSKLAALLGGFHLQQWWKGEPVAIRVLTLGLPWFRLALNSSEEMRGFFTFAQNQFWAFPLLLCLSLLQQPQYRRNEQPRDWNQGLHQETKRIHLMLNYCIQLCSVLKTWSGNCARRAFCLKARQSLALLWFLVMLASNCLVIPACNQWWWYPYFFKQFEIF